LTNYGVDAANEFRFQQVRVGIRTAEVRKDVAAAFFDGLFAFGNDFRLRNEYPGNAVFLDLRGSYMNQQWVSHGSTI